MTHYFSDNRSLAHDEKEFKFTIKDKDFIFKTDMGVFSKGHVDEGTRVLLETILRQDISGHALDLGCGYGVVSIVLSKLVDLKFMGVDLNPRAVSLAKENSKKNQVEVKYLVSDVFSNLNEVYNHILVNPPIRAGKSVIYKMFSDAYDHLEKGGSLWVVIRKQQGAKSALRKIEEIFNNCEIVEKEKGYWILKASKLLTF